MSWFRRTMGLDGFDVTVHVAVTCMVLFFIGMSRGPEQAIPVVVAASLVALAVRRKIALRSGGAFAGLTTGEMAAERIAELEQRVTELESVQMEVAELAERLDFAERLLATEREVPRLGKGAS